MSRETGIMCFKCLKRSGIDCPGRGKHESTLCNPCFVVVDLENRFNQAKHMLTLLDDDYLTLKQFNEFNDEAKDYGI